MAFCLSKLFILGCDGAYPLFRYHSFHKNVELKMRIFNFLIFKILLVLGSEDFKVALIQTPPRRYEVFSFQRKDPGNRHIRFMTIFTCPDPWIRAPQQVLSTLTPLLSRIQWLRTSFRTAFVLSKQRTGMKTRSLGTGTRNFEIQDGEDGDVLRSSTLDERLFVDVLFRLSQPWQKVFTCSWSSVRPEIYDEYEKEDLTIFFKYKTRRLSQTLVKIRHGADLRFVNSITSTKARRTAEYKLYFRYYRNTRLSGRVNLIPNLESKFSHLFQNLTLNSDQEVKLIMNIDNIDPHLLAGKYQKLPLDCVIIL